LEDLQPKFKYLITPESDTYPGSGGVLVTNLSYFISSLLKEII
jgi:hypothetical protein